MLPRNKKFLSLALTAAFLALSGCSPVTWIGMKVLYHKTELPDAQVIHDLCYDGTTACDRSHQLDLYLPSGKDWPTIMFVHGGGWTSGDKQLKVAGADVYGNIGRFYASHGIGVAVINYRHQFKVTWHEQVDDVRTAAAWVHSDIEHYGGQPKRIFLMGHSAGAYLVSFVGLTLKPNESAAWVRGVIEASGAGLDMTDAQTYRLGAKPAYYKKRFGKNDPTNEWKAPASPITYATAKAPPFLILYAKGETKALQRQATLFNDTLRKKGVDARLTAVPGESHERMVLALSRDDKTAGPAVLAFVEKFRAR